MTVPFSRIKARCGIGKSLSKLLLEILGKTIVGFVKEKAEIIKVINNPTKMKEFNKHVKNKKYIMRKSLSCLVMISISSSMSLLKLFFGKK